MERVLDSVSLSTLGCLLTALVALACSIYAIGYPREDKRSGAFEEHAAFSEFRRYYSLTPLFVSPTLLVAVANNAGVMWVAIEAPTLAFGFFVTFLRQAHLGRGGMEVRSSAAWGFQWRFQVWAYDSGNSGHRVLNTENAGGLNAVQDLSVHTASISVLITNRATAGTAEQRRNQIMSARAFQQIFALE